jgi:hypothetical protein
VQHKPLRLPRSVPFNLLPAAPRSVMTLGVLVAIALTVAGCADTAPIRRRPPPPEPRTAPPAEPTRPPVTTQVYVYPTSGQSQDQLSRDRYECYLWGVKQSGFDPSQTSLAPHQRVEVVPMPPSGSDTVAGAVTGAIIGAVVARDSGAGAVGGAILGGAAGAVSDSQREERVRQIQSRYDQRDAARMARLEEQANNYRRALSACLEGRGYTVK